MVYKKGAKSIMWTINDIINIINKIKEENGNVEILDMWFDNENKIKYLNIVYINKYGSDVLGAFKK